MVKLLEDVRSLQISQERWFKAADGEAAAVRVGVDPILVVLVSEAMNCITHAEL